MNSKDNKNLPEMTGASVISPEIGEDELDGATGGIQEWEWVSPGYTSSNPIVDIKCWFRHKGAIDSVTGRKECKSECKGLSVGGQPGAWYQCRCHGSNACVNRWHLECGGEKRTNW